MSYIKEKYANELDRPMTFDDLGGMRRPGFVPHPEEQEYIDSLDHDSFLESISMPAFYEMFDRIVGNDEVKRTLASVLTMTYLYEIPGCALVCGKTSSGKSEFGRCIAENLPRVTHWVSCQMLSPETYKGDYKLSSVIHSIPDDGRHHILIADEWDKLADGYSAETFYLKMNEWLPILEGNPGSFPKGSCPPERLTIICLGCFQTIRNVKSKKKKSIGFGTSNAEKDERFIIERDDLVNIAHIRPEIVGRFTHICNCDEPSVEIYEEIAHRELNKLSARMEMPIHMSNEELHQIAVDALNSDFGSRMISSCIRRRTEQFLFAHPFAREVNLLEESPAIEI